jgi:hypothetical protein
LTDEDFVVSTIKKVGGRALDNPGISAVQWAIGDDKNGLGFISQDYSWPKAKEYFTRALADEQPDNDNYGKAWRAVGETMHLVADMTIPAHVRNDGHLPYYDDEPLESVTTGKSVGQYFVLSSPNWSTQINYDQTPPSLMEQLATWTNKNFLSKDTVPLPELSTTANGKPAFSSPTWKGTKPSSDGYVWYKVDDDKEPIRMVKVLEPPWYAVFLFENPDSPSYEIDRLVLQDQQKLLIPTAVRAAESVIERFLPRFKVGIKVTADPNTISGYTVHGTLTHNTNAEWETNLVVRNGAYVVVNGKPQSVELANNDLNEFTATISAVPGSEVKVKYDLGGYVIESEPVIVSTTPTPEITTVKASIVAVWSPDSVVPTGVDGWGAYEFKGYVTLDLGGLSISEKDIKASLKPKNFSDLEKEFYFIRYPTRGFNTIELQSGLVHQITFEFSASSKIYMQKQRPPPPVIVLKGLSLSIGPGVPIPLLPGAPKPIWPLGRDFDIVISSSQ